MAAESTTNSPVEFLTEVSLQAFIERLKTFGNASQQADFINALRPGLLAEIIKDDVPAFVSVLSVLHSEKRDAQDALLKGLKRELKTPLNVSLLGLLKGYSDPATQAVFIKTRILWDDNPNQPVTLLLQALNKDVHQLFIEKLGMSLLGQNDAEKKFKITRRDLSDILTQIDPSLAPVLMNALARCARTIDEYNHLCNIVVPISHLRLFIDVALPILATTMCLASDLQAVLFGLPAEEVTKLLEFLSPAQWQTMIPDEAALVKALSRDLPGGKRAPALEPKKLLTLVSYLGSRLSVKLKVLEIRMYLDGKRLNFRMIYEVLKPYIISNQIGLEAWKDARNFMKQQQRDLGVIYGPELSWIRTLSRGLHKLSERPLLAVYFSGDEKSILSDLFGKLQRTLKGGNISEQQFQICQNLLHETLNVLDPLGTGAAFLQVAKQQLQGLKTSPVSVHREEIVEEQGPSSSSHFQCSR
jgi:hypothetical protein